jgi:hypothetical protein
LRVRRNGTRALKASKVG